MKAMKRIQVCSSAPKCVLHSIQKSVVLLFDGKSIYGIVMLSKKSLFPDIFRKIRVKYSDISNKNYVDIVREFLHSRVVVLCAFSRMPAGK